MNQWKRVGQLHKEHESRVNYIKKIIIISFNQLIERNLIINSTPIDSTLNLTAHAVQSFKMKVKQHPHTKHLLHSVSIISNPVWAI